MANQTTTETDYEKQFQDDLEKATALSLESLALEQYRRSKLQYSHSEIAVSKSYLQTQREQYAAVINQQNRTRPGSFRSQTSIDYDANSTNDPSQQQPQQQPPTVPPRRHSEIHVPKDKALEESDLISFTSPTAIKKEENANFENLIEEIQRLNVSHNPPNNMPPNYMGYQPVSASTNNFHQGLQLVPYANNSQQQQSAHKTPLTNEELQKLYNMPSQSYHPNQPQQHQMRPFIQTQSAPPLTASPFNYSPAISYGFNPNIFPTTQSPVSSQLQLQTPPPALSHGSIASSTAGPIKFPNVQMVSNPETALVATSVTQLPQNYASATSTATPTITAANNASNANHIQRQIAQIPKSASLSGVSSLATGGSSSSSNLRSQNVNSSSVSGSEITRRPKKSLGDDLIDLGHEDNSSRVSVLEAFDPLLSKNWDDGDSISDCATSYYSEYDPFDYLYSSGGTQYSDPVYEAVNKSDRTPMSPAAPIGWNIPSFDAQSIGPIPCTSSAVREARGDTLSPPPLPPRNNDASQQMPQINQVLDRRKGGIVKLYESVTDRKSYDTELMEFYRMIRDLRCQYKHTDRKTNIGHVIASEFNSTYNAGTSIKLMVHPCLEALRRSDDAASQGQIPNYGPPAVFTCDISTTVEHVIMHAHCTLEGQIIGSVNDFMLKPIGVVEWLSPSSKLSQLECVHDSLKLEQDVQLGLCPKSEANMNVIARTVTDDTRDMALKPEDILPNEHMSTITFDSMMILLETLETEIDKLEISVGDAKPHTVISCSGVIQGVKAICAVLGSIDTLEICDIVEELKNICSLGQVVYTYTSSQTPDIVSECGDYAEVQLRPKSTLDQIKLKCNYMREAIQQLIEMYVNAFRVDFCVKSIDYSTTPIIISCVLKPIMVNVSCLHRPPPNWKFDEYILGAQLYHGTRYISQPFLTQCSSDTSGGLFPRLKFDTWISFESNPICTLPRESRLIFVLYGVRAEPTEGNEQNNDGGQERKKINTELGWCAVQLFDYQSNMVLGTYLLSLWPPTSDKFLGPAPAKGSHPQPDFCPVLSIEIPSYGGRIVFPEPPSNPPPAPRYDFNSLDCNLQQELLDTAEQGYSGTVDKREVLWEKRHYLQAFPHALPKVLHAAHSWDYASLIDLHSLLNSWQPLTPLQSLELLLPRYPDLEVRAKAVQWISRMPNDQLVDFLPQVLQALKHDTYDASPMARFLLCKALESPRIAHHLYWLLVHSLPGDAPQNSMDSIQTTEQDESLITQARYHRRNKMMLRALLGVCGEKLASRFLSQNMMCKSLAETAQNVKQAKESMRQKTLIQGLEMVNQILQEATTSLPLDPSLEVYGVNARNSSFFNSYTLPLKISFIGPDHGMLPAIFKCGDDLQQDMLTIQLVRVMDKLWLAEGLDLKMVTFNCVPTGYKKGMIELVTDAETLRKIQVEYGLTGSFKDRPIAEWLARQNPSQLEYQRAVDNFTYSCAGYSVATYILGVCDRHNDNIMLKTSGHLFHIDFGKFLGDAQMFGNFKRDRTPFVLTSDMAYVINGGDKLSTKFHNFVDLCCKAFNIVRKHGDLILHMLALMATAGIPGVTADAVTYVRKALLPSQSNPEAAASFAKMIQFSLKSWFTQFNFFLHNLAQMRFTNDEGSGELLSFIPRTYTMKQDGRLKSVTVVSYQKRYDLEKYYTYILRVTRHSQPDPAYLFRSYKEFCEFHQKLCIHFPLAKLHSLPSGIHVGRSNIKTVAERRLPEIRKFLISLFLAADEIAHSDLVYTFFHPILRDQQEADIHVRKVKTVPAPNPTEPICGEIKLSLQYRRGALTVMIHHARGLAKLAGGQEPNTYVKCYLRPDPTKATKRKTKVIRKTCVPSFMETLEYRMPLEHIRNRTLEVTVWSHDTLQENVLLGGYQLPLAQLELREELVQWCRLGYLPRIRRDV